MKFISIRHSFMKSSSIAIFISLFLVACGGGGSTKENKTPTANAGDDKTVQVNHSITIIGSGIDADGSIKNYEWKKGSSIIATTASFNYTPTVVGTDTLTLTVIDNDDASAVDGMSVVVSSTSVPNQAPVAHDININTSEDNSKNITLQGTDNESDVLNYIKLSGPDNGTLSFDNNIATYTPTNNYNGSDSFTYKVNDGTQDSNTATVTISVEMVNDAPAVADISISASEDTAKAITLLGADVDGNSLSYTTLSNPTHGSVSINKSIAIYTPKSDYKGEDSFTYKASDGSLDSNTATVTISVETVNHAPIAEAVSASTDENTSKAITLVGTDSDDNSLNYIKVTDPAHGSVSFNNNIATYTPSNGYTGSDSFTYKVNDGTINSNAATVTINIETVNHAPIAITVNTSTKENTEKEITLVGTDSDGDLLNYIKVTDPTHGTVSFNDNIATYTPTTDYSDTDSFNYKVNDGSLDSNTATVNITVDPAVVQIKNWWQEKIDNAAIHPNSSTQIAALVELGGFGSGRMQIDFSISVNNSESSDPNVLFAAHPQDGLYLPDSDPVGSPIPVPTGATIEGSNDMTCDTSNDCHYIAKQGDMLYEVYRANLSNGELQGQGLAIWDLSKKLPATGRGEHCTSADAAGFPIQPLLWNADEIQVSLSSDATGNGDLGHAIRFILPNDRMASDNSLGGVSGRLYVRPASHAGGPRGPVNSVAYGARLKLRADFPDTGYNAATKVIINTMKRYGIALADGGTIALTAQSDSNTQTKWAGLGIESRVFDTTSGTTAITASDFSVIDTGQRIAETYNCVRN